MDNEILDDEDNFEESFDENDLDEDFEVFDESDDEDLDDESDDEDAAEELFRQNPLRAIFVMLNEIKDLLLKNGNWKKTRHNREIY